MRTNSDSVAIRLDRRRLLTGTAALGAATALTTTQPARTTRAQDSTLTIAVIWTPIDFDPHSSYDPGSGFVLSGVYESLIRQRRGDGIVLEPALAASWDRNDDASSWTFHLRPHVTFQDGSPLTAAAARDSFVRQMRLNLAPAGVLGRFITSEDQIVAVDTLTLRFDLGRPQSRFDIAMAAPFGASIMNAAAAMAHEVDGDLGHAWCESNTAGLGTGPYSLTSFDRQSSMVLDHFAGYWGGWNDDQFDTVVIRVVREAETRRQLIERGDVDLVESIGLDSVDDLESNPRLVVDRQTDMTVRYLAITQTEPFLQPAARQALCWAFPYEDVLNGIFLGYGELAQGPVSPNVHGFAAPAPPFTTDLDKARALLDQAGIPQGTKIQTIGFEGGAIAQVIAELYQEYLSQIGIQLDIEIMDYPSYIDLMHGDMPADERPLLFPSFWSPDYDDAWSQLWPLVSCDAWATTNAGHYCNDQVTELLERANNAPDETSYLQALAEIQQIVTYDDPAGIYFALPQWITVLRADIGGFELHPVISSYLDYYAMYRKTG